MLVVFGHAAQEACIIVDKGNSSDVKLLRDELVIWNNETGYDVELHFGNAKRLIGVLHAVCYADGAPLALRVRDDAEIGRHSYNDNCRSPQPGPSIVVCEPPPQECNF